MRIPVIKMKTLEERIDPSKWYRYREIREILSEFAEATVIRYLRKVPFVLSEEEVPGCKVKCKRGIRVYSGQALIDNGFVG